MEINPHIAAFWLFVALTSYRQVLYFWHQNQQKKLHQSKHLVQREDRIGSSMLSILYTLIWFGSGYELYSNDFLLSWYVLGLILVIIGIILRWKAIRDLGSNYGHEILIRTKQKLVTQGVYAWIRHPLYLALTVELLGMVLVAREIWVAAVWLILCAVLARRTLLEDKVLLDFFGNETSVYQKRVPRFNILAWLFRDGKGS